MAAGCQVCYRNAPLYACLWLLARHGVSVKHSGVFSWEILRSEVTLTGSGCQHLLQFTPFKIFMTLSLALSLPDAACGICHGCCAAYTLATNHYTPFPACLKCYSPHRVTDTSWSLCNNDTSPGGRAQLCVALWAIIIVLPARSGCAMHSGLDSRRCSVRFTISRVEVLVPQARCREVSVADARFASSGVR